MGVSIVHIRDVHVSVLFHHTQHSLYVNLSIRVHTSMVLLKNKTQILPFSQVVTDILRNSAALLYSIASDLVLQWYMEYGCLLK